MKIGNRSIITPAEDPLGYPLDWRCQLAQASLEAVDVKVALKDVDARRLAQHLQRRQKYPLREGGKPAQLDIVMGWKDSPARALLETFLLVVEPYQIVAGELGLPTDDVTLYARLFFDVRDEQGMSRSGILMRLHADLDGQEEDDPAVRLHRIALTGGLHALRRVLQANTPAAAPSLDQLVENELARRLHAGELRTGDLVRLQANAIARQRAENEKQDVGQTPGAQSMELVRFMLGLTAPHIVEGDRSKAQVESATEAIRGRLAAQRNVDATPLTDDADKGYEALNALMNKGFKAKAAERAAE
jgi:hypothetical protein